MTSPRNDADEHVSKRDVGFIHLILLIPVIIPLAVPLFNNINPRLGGWPMFYWFQLLMVPVCVLCTLAVFRYEKNKKQHLGGSQ